MDSLSAFPNGTGNSQATLEGIALKGIVNDATHDMFEYVLDLWITSLVCYLGVLDNIVAILVFVKMGFQNTINISLVSIALWDCLKCFCGIIIRVYGPIQLFSVVFAENWKIVTMIIFGYLYTISGYVSGILAAYVAIERCLCVSLPLTIKFLLTRKVVITTNVVIPFLVFGCHAITYAIVSYTFVFNEKLNATVAIITYTPFSDKYPAIDVVTNYLSMLSPTFSFVVMIISSSIITYHLKKASKIRMRIKEKPKDVEKSTQLSARDRQVIKMLLVIITVYIGAYIPKIITYVGMLIVPAFRPSGLYRNLQWISLYFMFLFDYINAVVNPFIFFFMSSTFNSTLKEMFRFKKGK